MPASRNVAAIFLSSIVLTVSLWAAPMARISRPIDSRSMTRLRANVHPMARPDFDQGALDPSQVLHRVVIMFNRTPAQQQALDRLTEEQQDPTSPNYHNWLTPEQFADQFGMSESDIAKVKDWLTSQGFTIEEVARGRGYIAFSGSVAQINSAFQTEMHQYAINGEVHYANAISPSVPSAMAHVVSAIRSLDDFKPKPRGSVHKVDPRLTSGLSGNHFLTPDDFAAIYNINALYSAGIDGTGQKIAIVGQSDIVAGDITTFRSVSGLPANAPSVILVPGSADPGVVSGDVGEASLDLEWAGAVARKATLVYVNSKNGAFDSLFYAINNNTAPILSVSYGTCEAQEVSGGFLNSDEAMMQQASAQGQVIVGPAGDSGAADCDTSNPATKGLAVDFPASSPYVVGIGGTTFNEGTGTYWSATNDSLNGSALFYIPEVVWNDTSSANGLSATGGGASKQFTKPSWQVATGVPADGMRDVPDISFSASAAHDEYITCVQGDCKVCFPGAAGEVPDANCPSSTSPGYRSDSTNWFFDAAGGTSAGVPTFAGVVALINQKMGSPQGSINPRLYQLAASASGSYIFHDVTSGDNRVPCQSGTPDCPSGTSSIGFTAAPGYDQTTGLGSVDAYNLVTNWNATGTPPAADFSVAFVQPSLTVARGSSATIMVRVQRQNGFNGTVNFSCSSAMSGITCSPSPTTLNPDGAVTVTITASATASLRTPASHSPLAPWWESAFGVAAFFSMGIGRRRSKLQMVVIALLVTILIIGLASCGGGSSSTGGNTGGNGGGNTGGSSGTVTLQATSGSLSHNAQITVSVQ